MDSLTVSQLSKKSSRDSDIASEDDRGTSPTRKLNKTKHKGKTSTSGSRETGKSKIRASKGPQSTAALTQEMMDLLKPMKIPHSKSTSDIPITTLDELHAEHDHDNDQIASCLTKMALDEKDQIDILQRNEAATLQNVRYSIGEFSITLNEKPSWLREPEPKNMVLEDRLENDNEFDITGILNLSCMNVTDNDLPTIIQRAFSGGPKKCTGLILRDNALTSDGVRMIVDTMLAARASLKYLSLSSNPDIGDAGIEHIVRLLQKNRSITFLALPRTGMTDRGVRLLADVLCGVDSEAANAAAHPPPLEKLYISFNKSITDESCEALLQILEQNRKLKVLSLVHCSISDEAYRRLKQVATKLRKKKFSFSG